MAAEAPMKFPDRRNGLRRRVGKDVEYIRRDDGPRGWVSTTLRVYVGARKAARA